MNRQIGRLFAIVIVLFSICPFFAQSRSKCGDLAGMRMYSTRVGTMEESQS